MNKLAACGLSMVIGVLFLGSSFLFGTDSLPQSADVPEIKERQRRATSHHHQISVAEQAIEKRGKNAAELEEKLDESRAERLKDREARENGIAFRSTVRGLLKYGGVFGILVGAIGILAIKNSD